MGRLFGTDGVRGIANTELDCQLAMDIARAAAIILEDELGKTPHFLIGSDTRISADMLRAAVMAGLCSVGSNCIDVGVVPTSAISYLVAAGHAEAGIMISASHNPFEFNGIKIFGPDGYKLSDEQEFGMEEIILDKVRPYPQCWKDDIGTISQNSSLLEDYIDHLVASANGTDLSGVKVVLDCSHGSASVTAKLLFDKLGVKTTIVYSQPDGLNINDNCGSTHIDRLAELVKGGGFDVGFAFDGDADRCLMVDENGSILDGDTILAVLAKHLIDTGKLEGGALVATIMSNMGLARFAKSHGINLEATKVGDRYVLEKMLEKGYKLGGEQSGHVILLDYMGTGDGQLTAVQMLVALKESGKAMSELASIIDIYPQVTKNFRADGDMKSALRIDDGAKKIINRVAEKLGEEGRILVRASGTEPLIRVMIEGKNLDEIKQLVEEVSDDLSVRLTKKVTSI